MEDCTVSSNVFILSDHIFSRHLKLKCQIQPWKNSCAIAGKCACLPSYQSHVYPINMKQLAWLCPEFSSKAHWLTNPSVKTTSCAFTVGSVLTISVGSRNFNLTLTTWLQCVSAAGQENVLVFCMCSVTLPHVKPQPAAFNQRRCNMFMSELQSCW